MFYENNPTNATITNNLFYSNVADPGYGIAAYPCTNCTETDNITDQDPQFLTVTSADYTIESGAWADVTWTDFRLKFESPAIEAGNSSLGQMYDQAFDSFDTNWPPTVVQQDDYNAEWEIGAFVYPDLEGKPSPPQNLHIVQ